MTCSVAGVLLAAGSSRRFGGDKLCHPLSDGTPMVVASATMLLQVVDVLAIIVDRNNRQTHDLLIEHQLPPIGFDHAKMGMGSTLAYAIKQLVAYDAWVVALADMPFVKPSTIQSVANRLQRGDQLVAPVHNDVRGHPVGFGRHHFDTLSSLTGDIGGKSILSDHHGKIVGVPVNDAGCLYDIDVPGDLLFIPH